MDMGFPKDRVGRFLRARHAIAFSRLLGLRFDRFACVHSATKVSLLSG